MVYMLYVRQEMVMVTKSCQLIILPLPSLGQKRICTPNVGGKDSSSTMWIISYELQTVLNHKTVSPQKTLDKLLSQ
jgi:hypothetical protein